MGPGAVVIAKLYGHVRLRSRVFSYERTQGEHSRKGLWTVETFHAAISLLRLC